VCGLFAFTTVWERGTAAAREAGRGLRDSSSSANLTTEIAEANNRGGQRHRSYSGRMPKQSWWELATKRALTNARRGEHRARGARASADL